MILGGINPCQDGLGHLFKNEVCQSVCLSAAEERGWGVQSLFGQYPNTTSMNLDGASLRYRSFVVPVQKRINSQSLEDTQVGYTSH